MKKSILNCVAAALALHYGAMALADDNVAEATYEARIERADADYKVAMAKCDSLQWNPEDICQAEAKKAREIAQGYAKATHEGTAEARADARKDAADAELKLAKEKCDRMDGNEQDVCVKAAQLQHTRAATSIETSEEVAKAADEQHKEVHDAKYDLAMEKCESLQGDAQDECEHSAKAHKH